MKSIDRQLGIRTEGFRNNENNQYKRTESTDYAILDWLFTFYTLPEGQSFVDFGCGKGRALFYVAYHFARPVYGIEVNILSYAELEQNRRRFLSLHPNASIQVTRERAEYYSIRPDQAVFYFFNPFSLNIFKQVMQRIVDSLEESPRACDIIYYYPLGGVREFLCYETPFEEIHYRSFPGAIDPNDQILICRYTPPNNK